MSQALPISAADNEILQILSTNLANAIKTLGAEHTQVASITEIYDEHLRESLARAAVARSVSSGSGATGGAAANGNVMGGILKLPVRVGGVVSLVGGEQQQQQ